MCRRFPFVADDVEGVVVAGQLRTCSLLSFKCSEVSILLWCLPCGMGALVLGSVAPACTFNVTTCMSDHPRNNEGELHATAFSFSYFLAPDEEWLKVSEVHVSPNAAYFELNATIHHWIFQFEKLPDILKTTLVVQRVVVVTCSSYKLVQGRERDKGGNWSAG